MEFLHKKIGPVFLKENSDAEEFIEKMKALAERAEGKLKKDIEKHIKLAIYGIQGEKNIAYELRNSGMDMLILHDLYFEFNGLQSQIDYIIITRKRTYILECKNLIGNIEIDNGGNFVRTYEINGKKVKEGLYSPITQNERHRNIIREMRLHEKNFIGKFFFERNFDNAYKAVVVLANPKTYLNARFAKKDIKNQVIRADQLIAYIKQSDKEVTAKPSTLEEMQSLASFFLEKNRPLRSDYAKKYDDMLNEVMHKKEQVKDVTIKEETPKEMEYQKKETLKENPPKKECQKEELSKEKSPKVDASKNEIALKTVKGEQDKKICPRCGSELVLREAKRGDNIGQKFWGCCAYPKCRYIEGTEA